MTVFGSHVTLHRTRDGALVARLNGPVDTIIFSPDPKSRYFLVRYTNDQSEVWTTEEQPHRLYRLGINLDMEAAYFTNGLLVLRYRDGEANILVMDLLAELGDNLSTVPSQDLIQLTCKRLFAPDQFDEARLEQYLEGYRPQACR